MSIGGIDVVFIVVAVVVTNTIYENLLLCEIHLPHSIHLYFFQKFKPLEYLYQIATFHFQILMSIAQMTSIVCITFIIDCSVGVI